MSFRLSSLLILKLSVYLFVFALTIPSCHTQSLEDRFDITTDSVYITYGNESIFGYVYRPVNVECDLPAMIFLQGGGDVGLDNYLFEPKYCAKLGMITLVCDKSGAGNSKGSTNWRDQSFRQKVNEYSHLFEWLRAQEGVDPNCVGVHGMSEGGRLAVALAIQNANVAFVNSVSGPMETYLENRLFALGHYFTENGIAESIKNDAVDLWRQYLEQVGEGEVQQSLINEVNDFRASNPEIGYLPGRNSALPRRPLKEDVHYTFGGSLNELKCPVLFQYGVDDIIVDAKAADQLIPKRDWIKMAMYEDTNHNMNKDNNVHPNFDSDKMLWLQEIGVLK